MVIAISLQRLKFDVCWETIIADIKCQSPENTRLLICAVPVPAHCVVRQEMGYTLEVNV